MAAAARSTKYATLAVSEGPESSVLVDSSNIDVDSNIDFAILGACEGVEVTIISASAKTGTPSVVFTLQRFDDASGTYTDLIASSALSDAGNTWLLASHHAAAVANHSVGRMPGEKMRVKIDYTGTPVTDVLNGVTITANCV